MPSDDLCKHGKGALFLAHGRVYWNQQNTHEKECRQMQATIHNEYLTLTVDTHGAEAVSLKNAAGEELLWQADPAVWERHAPILFPWTGKLKDGSFTHGGKTYKGGQHGFARDVEHTLLEAEGDTIRPFACPSMQSTPSKTMSSASTSPKARSSSTPAGADC